MDTSSSTSGTNVSTSEDSYSFLDSDESISELTNPLQQASPTPDQEPAHPGHPSDLLSQPLYDGTSLTTLDSSILLLQFSIRHRLSKAALSELLQLVTAHLPSSAQNQRSLYKLKQIFTSTYFRDVTPLTQYLCTCCGKLLQSSTRCHREACEGASTKEFVYVPLDSQIKHKMEGMLA